MPDPRGVEDRLTWFLTHDPGGVGMCARHSWRALGGDQGNPPRWFAEDANAVYDKVRASGRYFTTPPPRGALILWPYGKHGHAALSMGGGRIATTDPTGKPGGTGVEPIGYPARWGAKGYIWTDQYAGVRFEVGTMSNNIDYNYSGKPKGDLTLGTRYTRLDVAAWDPPRKGLEHTLVYLNITPTKWATGKDVGGVRVRLVRADGDNTGYQDYTIAKDSLDDGGFLISYTYFEDGDGRPKRVEVRCQGGLLAATVGTRYVKAGVVVD